MKSFFQAPNVKNPVQRGRITGLTYDYHEEWSGDRVSGRTCAVTGMISPR